MVTLWHRSVLEQSFSVQNLFYNDILVDILFKRLDRREKVVVLIANISTFILNDRSQSCYCVLPVIRCAFSAHLDVGLAKRSTLCRFFGTLTFPSLCLGEDCRLCRVWEYTYNTARVPLRRRHLHPPPWAQMWGCENTRTIPCSRIHQTF